MVGKIQTICVRCEAPFETWRYLVRQGRGRHCSDECRIADQMDAREGQLTKAGLKSRRFREKNPEYYRTEDKREYKRVWMQNRMAGLKALIYEKLGDHCARCGFNDQRALCIDHVNGGGYVELRSTSVITYLKKVLDDTSGTYQILCQNCNWIKRHENNEYRKPKVRL